MTEKIYYSDAYVSEADCRVVNITEGENGRFTVELDSTPFFAEGGGQPCDTGFINSVPVTYVGENGGIITHTLASKPDFSVGDTVHCRIDSATRFERMRAHSGEHVVSGVAHSLFGVENVGFHMDENYIMTVDFDKPLSDDDIKLIESRANAVVRSNVSITAEIYSPEEAKKKTYRSKKDFDTDIRLVRIDGVDACACCAPHVKSTGEIGLILITSRVSHRGGVRITLCCGETAYNLASKRYEQVKLMAGMLVEKQELCVEALEKYMEKADAARYEANVLRDRICSITAESITVSDGITVALCTLSPAEMTKTGALLRSKAEKPIVLLSGDDENGYAYIVTAKDYPLREKAKEFNTALCGRGGGRDEMIQGSFRADFETIKNYFKEYKL